MYEKVLRNGHLVIERAVYSDQETKVVPVRLLEAFLWMQCLILAGKDPRSGICGITGGCRWSTGDPSGQPTPPPFCLQDCSRDSI